MRWRDAHTVRMKKRRLELHLRGHMGVFIRERQSRTEEASYATLALISSPILSLLRSKEYSPPYNFTSSEIINITSHSKTLLSTSPQLIPGILSLSDCICWNWRVSMRPAGEVAISIETDRRTEQTSNKSINQKQTSRTDADSRHRQVEDREDTDRKLEEEKKSVKGGPGR